MVATIGHRLPALLRHYGVDTVFGIPGVHTIELYRGLEASGIRHVTPRHEQGAGFMADGYARVSGRPGVCFVISGPGVTNILTAMGQAYADSIPMLVISSVNRQCELGKGEGRLHELKDQRAMAQGVSAFSHTVTSFDDLLSALARAFRIFASDRPRPVHLEIPIDVLHEQASALPLPPVSVAARRGPAPDAVEKASRALRCASSVVVVLGGGAVDCGSSARLLAEKLNAPTVMTINGKGLLPPEHPLSLGSTLPCAPVLDVLRTADVVLAIGTELGETDTLLFDDSLKLQGQLIRIDVDAAQFHCNGVADIAVLADATLAVNALLEALESHEPKQNGPEVVAALREAAFSTVPKAYKVYGDILSRIADTHTDAVFVGDSNQVVYGANLTLDMRSPRSYFNSSTGYGTLGYGLPAAIGAALGAPHRKVISIMGDGGMQFTLSELSAAVELRLPLPIILWNNKGYGEIKRYMMDASIDPIGVDIHTPDFLAVAKGMGCRSSRVAGPEHFFEVLEQAFQAEAPTILELIEKDALEWRWSHHER